MQLTVSTVAFQAKGGGSQYHTPTRQLMKYMPKLFVFGQSMAAGVTLPSDGNVIRELMLETVMTFTLVYVVLSTTTNKISRHQGKL